MPCLRLMHSSLALSGGGCVAASIQWMLVSTTAARSVVVRIVIVQLYEYAIHYVALEFVQIELDRPYK